MVPVIESEREKYIERTYRVQKASRKFEKLTRFDDCMKFIGGNDLDREFTELPIIVFSNRNFFTSIRNPKISIPFNNFFLSYLSTSFAVISFYFFRLL